jgi:hypothetical protein
VNHQIVHRDRPAARRRNLEIEIAIDIGIKVDFARLDLLHHGRPGKQL